MTNKPDFYSQHDTVRALRWTEEGLQVLDQRLLPKAIHFDCYDSSDGVVEAIRTMRVRGAPAIGIAAAFGVVLAARARYCQNSAEWKSLIVADLEKLAESRPTAVNLHWALNRMHGVITEVEGNPEPTLLAAAQAILEEDLAGNRRMADLGADLIRGAKGVLTHCNTGSLATGGYGTALGVIRSAHALGLQKIFATETRPWLQGARLTVWELDQDLIPATLIADSAAAWLMNSGAVQWVIVGADRIAANGDTANKIGTYSLAVNARYHGVKFMVVAPTSTLDWSLTSGQEIAIEQRDQRELLGDFFLDERHVIDAWNPVFDVTPAHLIDVIVTDRGVVENPNPSTMRALIAH